MTTRFAIILNSGSGCQPVGPAELETNSLLSAATSRSLNRSNLKMSLASRAR